MNDSINLIFDEDGFARIYDSAYDITIHCESQEEQDKVWKMLNRRWRWIPCSEKLPEEGERVLATHLGGLNPSRQVIEHIYQSEQFTLGWDMDMDMKSPTFGKRQMGKVIAWMPMPEPYGGENGENT